MDLSGFGADDRVDDANADSVSVFLVPQCEERPGTLHEVRGYLPVVCSTMTGYPATRYRLGIHWRDRDVLADPRDLRNSCGVWPVTCCQFAAALSNSG
jgi:hypothetical protein